MNTLERKQIFCKYEILLHPPGDLLLYAQGHNIKRVWIRVVLKLKRQHQTIVLTAAQNFRIYTPIKKEATKSVCSKFIFQTAHGTHDIVLICEVHKDRIPSQVKI